MWNDEWIYTTLCGWMDPESAFEASLPPAVPEPVFRRMLAIARIHGVLGIVLAKLGAMQNRFPEVLRIASRAWQGQVVRSLRARHHGRHIAALFNVAGIPAAQFKGPDFAENCYPNPRLRPTSDVDLFVPWESWPDAVRLLEQNGHFEKKRQAPMKYATGLLGERTWVYASASRTEVDLHWNLVDLPSMRAKASVQFDDLLWQRTSNPGDSNRIANPETRLVVACMHAIYHHQFSRLLQMVDILQTARQINTEEQRRNLQGMAARTSTRVAIDISLAVASRFLACEWLEDLRKQLALPVGSIPDIPEALFIDARTSLFSIRDNLKARCRLNIRQWLRDAV